MSRDSAIYVLGLLIVFPFSLLSAIVFTHLLSQDQYGDLGILFLFAGFLTFAENLVTLQGTFSYVYGGGDDEGKLDDEDDAESTNKRRAMTTGALAMLAVIAALSLPLVLFADTIAGWLIRDPESGDAIVWAVASAATGALWRPALNLFRLERRPKSFAALSGLRPVVVLAVSIPLVTSGFGVNGALMGTAFGTLASVAVCALLLPSLFTSDVSRTDLRAITSRGGKRIPTMVALWTLHNADLFYLSRFATAADLSLYRLASRFASVPSYFSSGFFLAWGPLRRTSVFRAATEEDAAY